MRYTAPLRTISLTRFCAIACLSMTVFVACSNTVYDFFPEGANPSTGTGGGCAVAGCTTGFGATATSDSGSETTNGGPSGSGGHSIDTGSAGAPPNEDTDACMSKVFPDAPMLLIRFTQSGNCIRKGDPIPLGEDTGFAIETGACTQAPEGMWTANPYPYALSFRNEAVNLNLDVQFSSPAGGTPLVLYDPHPGYNQRFGKLGETASSFLLSPRFTQDMCLTEINGRVEIWPCNSAVGGQLIEFVDCELADAVD